MIDFMLNLRWRTLNSRSRTATTRGRVALLGLSWQRLTRIVDGSPAGGDSAGPELLSYIGGGRFARINFVVESLALATGTVAMHRAAIAVMLVAPIAMPAHLVIPEGASANKTQLGIVEVTPDTLTLTLALGYFATPCDRRGSAPPSTVRLAALTTASAA
jgi:hypothetical protein